MTCPHGAPSRWRCQPCRSAYQRAYMIAYRRHDRTPPRNWLQAAILSYLAAAPHPVATADIVDHVGRDQWAVCGAIRRARRAGHPVVTLSPAPGRTGYAVRYRLAS